MDRVRPRLVIPLHWDNFFRSLDAPARGMYRLVERTEVAFDRLARYCEAHDIDCLIQPPRTSVTL